MTVQTYNVANAIHQRTIFS